MKTTTLSKLCTVGMVIALLFVSCKKKEGETSQGFKASIEQSGSSRTHGEVGGNDDVVNVKWTAYDQILVSNNADNASASTTLNYELTEGEDTRDGIFYTGMTHDDFFHPNYAAIYPNVNSRGTANSLSGKNATFNLPATQPYAANNVFAEKVVPMVAYSSNQTLSFKNACGGLRFPMVGSNVIVQRVELTTPTFNTNDHLCGQFAVDCSSNDPTLAWQSGGGNTITIDCGSGITLGTAETYFYFMLPPGTLHGLSLTAYDNNNQVVYHAENETDYEIVRNKIKKVGANLEIPLEVTTVSPTYITATSAKGGVSVANGTATETGICWGLSNTPDINGSPDIDGSPAQGTTEINMTDLKPDKVYYVRAYAKSANNTVYYGDAIPFAVRPNYTNGIIPYEFSVSASQKVYFSMGNLQYRANPSTWRFAESQCDYIGAANANISQTYSGWIDLFAWGASGYNHRTYVYEPWVHENANTADGHYTYYYAYNTANANLNSSTGKADWGYNKISNGGNAENQWRTWTKEEMMYLFLSRSGYRFSYAQITLPDKTVNGLMLYPDGFTPPSSISLTYNNTVIEATASVPDGNYNNNVLTEAQWSLLEQKGVAFLPAAGGRSETTVGRVNSVCNYWTATAHEQWVKQRYAADITNGRMSLGYYEGPWTGFAVRLVKNK